MITTRVCIFHGEQVSQNGIKYPTQMNVIVPSINNSDIANLTLISDINSSGVGRNGTNYLDQKMITPPIRFKLQDSDEPDYSYPLAIPQDDGVVYYSYRKQIKLQFFPDNISKTQNTVIQNLRIYMETQNNTLESGITIKMKTSTDYEPATIMDITNGLGQEGVQDLTLQTKLNPITVQSGVVFTSVVKDQENNIININLKEENETDVPVDLFYQRLQQKYFGNQPYVYLIVGLTNQQEPGKQTQFNVYYVYDEI